MRRVSLWVAVSLVAFGPPLWRPRWADASGPNQSVVLASRPASVQFVPVRADSASGQLVFVQGPPSYGHSPEGPPTFTPPAGPTCSSQADRVMAGAGVVPQGRVRAGVRDGRGGLLSGLKRLFGRGAASACPHGFLDGTGCPICSGPKYWGPTHHHTYYYRPPSGLVYPPQNLRPAVIQYPFYTVKGPTDFFYNE